MSTLATLVVKIVGDVGGLSSTMNEAGATVRRAGADMTAFGGNLTARLSLPLIGVGVASTVAFNQFASGMANVASLVPPASDEILGMSGDVQSLAVEMGKSTGDMTTGLYQVISAFGYGSDSLAQLELNARAASAGLATTEQAIALTSAVTKGYGDTSAAAVQSASDLALTTVQLGQTTFPELAASIGRVVPLASSLGVTQQELFAVMATGSGVTGTASEVATQFRGILQSLMAPTDTMTGLIGQLGYSSGQAMLEQMGLQGSINAIVQAAQASGTPLQSYMGSIEGQTLALTLAGPQADAFTEKLTAMGNAAGATDAAFAIQTQGMNAGGFAMQQLAVQGQVLLQNLGQALAPVVLQIANVLQTQLMPAIQGVITWFTSLDSGTQTIILTIAGIVVAIGPVVAVFGFVVSAIGTVISVLGLLLGPVGLLIAVAVALYAAWNSNFMGIRDVVNEVMPNIRSIIESVMNIIRGIIAGVMQMMHGDVSGGMDTIKTSFSTAWDNIRTQISAMLTTIINYVRDHLPEWIAKLGEWAEAAWKWLQEAVPPLLVKLGDFVSGLLAELGRKLPGWISAFVAWAEKAWKWLEDAVPPLLAKLGAFVSGLLAELGRKLPGWLTSLGSWAEAAWKWLQEAVGPLLVKLGEFVLALIGELGRKLPGWISAFLGFAAAAIGWVATAIPPLLVELAKFLASAVTWIIGTAIPGLVLAALGLAAALIGWVATTLIPGILPALGEFLASVLTFIGNMIVAVVKAAIEVGEGIVNGIREGVQNIWDTFMDWISDLIGGLPEWLKHLLGISSPSRVMADQIGGPLVMGIVAGMQEAMPTALANIGDLMNQIVGAMSGALNTGGLTGGSGAAIGEMLRWVRAMVEALVAASEWLVNVCEAARDRAKLFVDLAGDLIGIFQDAIGLLTTLADAGSLPVSSGGIVIPIMQFIANMIHTVLAQIAVLLPNIVAAQERLAAFNTAAQATITTMQAAVGLVSSLGEIEIVTNVSGALGVVVDVVLGLVRRLSEQLTPAMMQAVIAARLFSDQAGPVVALVGQAVGIVSQLAAVKIFDVDAAMAAVRQVIIRAVQALRDAAGVISADGLAAARVFAEGMGGILGIIGQAVSLLTSAAGAEGWQDLDIDRMFMALRQVIVRSVQVLRDAAGVISADGLAAARAFADGMGSIMDVVGSAVDVLGAAAGTTDWQKLSIDQIFIALRQVIVRSVQILRDASGFVAAEGLAAARAFADGMGDIMDVVGAAVDVLGAAAGTTDWEKLDIDRVFTALRQVIVRAVQTLRDASGFVAAEGLAAARAFADGMGDIMDVVGAAVDVLGAAAGATDWETLDIDRVFVMLKQVIVRSVQTLRDASGFVAAEGLAAARAFADGMGDILDVIGQAMDVLTALAEWQPVDVDGAFVYIRQVIVAAVRVLREASEATGSGLDAAAAFALRSLGMLEAVQRALDVLKALAEFEIPDALAVVQLAWEQMRKIIDLIRGGLMFELAELERYDLLMGAFTMGSSWVQALIEGILSRMPDLVAVLSYISGLFPHSPAKYGPLAQRPDWNSYLMGGLDQAGDALARRLAGAMPGGRLALAPATASGGRGGQTINVTINNPRGEVSERSLRRELLMLSQLGVLD